MKKCSKCKKVKDRFAFIGRRSACRLCWLNIPQEERQFNIIDNIRIEDRRKKLYVKKSTF